MPNLRGQKTIQGFTLAELLVSLAIVSVLAAIALPAYNSYALRSKFSEVIAATAPTKTAISTCATTGSCVANGSLNLSQNGSSTINPSATTDGLGTVNQYAAEYALNQAYVAYNGTGWSDAQSASYAAMIINSPYNQYVATSLSNPNVLGQILSDGSFYTDNTYPPMALFLQYYALDNPLLISLPCVNGPASGCTPPTKYTTSVLYNTAGVITATAASRSGLNAETVVLTPSYASGRVDWSLSGSCKTRSGGAIC